jgi:hypothetical protein
MGERVQEARAKAVEKRGFLDLSCLFGSSRGL